MTISNSISIPRGLKSFMLKNCKVDFLGNSEVAFFLYTRYQIVCIYFVLYVSTDFKVTQTFHYMWNSQCTVPYENFTYNLPTKWLFTCSVSIPHIRNNFTHVQVAFHVGKIVNCTYEMGVFTCEMFHINFHMRSDLWIFCDWCAVYVNQSVLTAEISQHSISIHVK